MKYFHTQLKNSGLKPALLFFVILLFTLFGVYYVLNMKSATTLNADFNSDGAVNSTDLSILATNWGHTSATKAMGDSNNNGTIDIYDLSMLATEWGQTINQPPVSSDTIDGVVGLYVGFSYQVNAWKGVLPKLKAYGMNNVRVILWWDHIQLSDGVCDPAQTAISSTNTCDWAATDSAIAEVQKQGLTVDMALYSSPLWSHPAIDDGHYAPDDPSTVQRFTNALMTRYSGKIRKLQVWNEPNATGFFMARYNSGETLAKSYTDILKQAYIGAKAGDPDVIVVGGNSDGRYTTGSGATPTFYAQDDFLTACYSAGAKGYFDEWGTHNYMGPPHTRIPELSLGWANNHTPWNIVQNIRSILDSNGDTTKGIEITEVGFCASGTPDASDDHGDAPTLASEARYNVRHIVHAFENNIKTYQIMYIYDVTNAPLGIFNSDLTPRPAVIQIGNLLSKLSGFKFDSRINDSNSNNYIYKFTNASGKIIYVAWTSVGEVIYDPPSNAPTVRGAGNTNVTLPINGTYTINDMNLTNLGSLVAGQSLTLTNDPKLIISN